MAPLPLLQQSGFGTSRGRLQMLHQTCAQAEVGITFPRLLLRYRIHGSRGGVYSPSPARREREGEGHADERAVSSAAGVAMRLLLHRLRRARAADPGNYCSFAISSRSVCDVRPLSVFSFVICALSFPSASSLMMGTIPRP